MRKLFLSVLLGLVGGLSVQAAKYYCYPSGGSDNWGTRVDGTKQAGLPATIAAGDELWLQAGTYEVSATIALSGATKIYGGFAGTETSIADREQGANAWIFTNATILKATATFDAIFQVSTTNLNVVVDGITFEGDGKDARAMRGLSSGPTGSYTIRNSIVQNFNKTGDGAALDFRGGTGTTPLIEYCLIQNNQGTAAGTIYLDRGTIHDCKIINNTNTATNNQATGGGGLFLASNGATGYNLWVEGNISNYAGGVFIRCNTSGTRMLYNSVIINNTAEEGAGIGFRKSTSQTQTDKVYNCLIANNRSTNNTSGCGVAIGGSTATDPTGVLVNNIFYNNTNADADNTVVNIKNTSTKKPTFTNNIIDVNTYSNIDFDATTILNSNPNVLFTNITGGDYTPTSSSPGIDAGTATGLTYTGNIDIAGNPRQDNNIVDIGPYEFQTVVIVNADVTLDVNGGIAMKTTSYTVSTLLPMPYPGASRRAGYIFAGWYEQSNPNPATDTPVLFPYVPAASGNKTLYAGWIAETDYNTSSNFTTYQSRVMRNSVFDKNTKIKDIAMLGAHDAFTALTSGSAVKAQELSGYQLAQRGVRIFDTRVMLDGSTWKTHHGTKTVGIYVGEKNQAMANDIADIIKFADENPGEVLILYLWPKESLDLGETSNLASFWSTLEAVTYNGKTLSDFMNYSNATAFKDLTYGDVTDDGSKAGIIIFALDGYDGTATAQTGIAHNAYSVSSSVVANDYSVNISVDDTKTNIGNKTNFSDTNRLRVSWCQKYNNGTLNIAGYVDDWNVQFATDANLQTWLAKSPVLMFDFINHTDAFSSAFNAATQKYNRGEENVAVSAITINATNVNITSAVSTKTGETAITLATDGTVTEVPDAATRKIEITFTLPAGNHDPYVSVNGTKVTPIANYPTTGSYYLSVVGVEEDKNIIIYAFAENVIPASEDTYIGRRSSGAEPTNPNANYSASRTLMACGPNISNSYGSGRAFTRFDISQIDISAYNKVTLKVTVEQWNSKNFTRYLGVYTVPTEAIETGFSTVTWNTGSGYAAGATGVVGTQIAVGTKNYSGSGAAGTNYVDEVEIPQELISTVIVGTSDLYLQLIEESTASGDGGILTIHSLENGNPNYVPVLVFSQPAFKVSAPQNASASNYITSGDNANGDVIFYEDGQLLNATNFTPVNGVVKVVKTFATDKWYPIGFPFAVASIDVEYGSLSKAGIIYNGTEDVPTTQADAAAFPSIASGSNKDDANIYL
ncbi:MAG: hypothetical protein LBR66_08420, partial [Candidatus Symbiothrix sp.]|nr:hypothetical protein [Candidatus Symbiothrix sp.]